MILLLIVLLISLSILVYLSFGKYRIEQDCTCDKNREKCVSKIEVNDRVVSWSISRKPSELLECGKVQKQLDQIKDIK